MSKLIYESGVPVIYKKPIKRKIINNDDVIVTEVIKKTVTTKNTIKETIIRTTTKAILLECCHLIPVTDFNIVPKVATNCYECGVRHE